MIYIFKKNSNPPTEREDMPPGDYQGDLPWESESSIIISQSRFTLVKLEQLCPVVPFRSANKGLACQNIRKSISTLIFGLKDIEL